jgi:hypothetical protein
MWPTSRNSRSVFHVLRDTSIQRESVCSNDEYRRIHGVKNHDTRDRIGELGRILEGRQSKGD